MWMAKTIKNINMIKLLEEMFAYRLLKYKSREDKSSAKKSKDKLS